MAIQTALLLKGLGGLGVVGVFGTSVYFLNDYLQNSISKYDQALIDFLEDGGNIKFKVTYKKGDEASETELSSDFPTFETGKKTITAIVKVSTEDSSSTGTLTELTTEDKKRAAKEVLRKTRVETNNEWNWSCEMVFDRKNSTKTTLKDEFKDKVFKTANEGLLGILKEGESDKKKEKQEFIRKCGESRGWRENKRINNENKETITAKASVFELKEGGENLVPENSSEFDRWFKS